MSEITEPVFGHDDPSARPNLQRFYARICDPIGERIIVHARVLDKNARLVPNTRLEVGQADAVGPCAHPEGGGQTEEGPRSWG